jgi:hypothetical protein
MVIFQAQLATTVSAFALISSPDFTLHIDWDALPMMRHNVGLEVFVWAEAKKANSFLSAKLFKEG